MKTLPVLMTAVLLAAASRSSAAIVHSGPAGIVVPWTFTGVYLNVLTGATSLSEPPDFYGSPTAAWVNVAFGGVDVVSGNGLAPAVQGGDQVVNIPFNTPVDAALLFPTGPNASTTHLGPAPQQFQAGVPGLIGFRMNPTGSGDQFGWLRVTLRDDGSAGTIHDYAYETVVGLPIPAGVPEPGMVTVLVMGGGALLARRQRRGCTDA
jgi:hypothetical protein